MSTEKDERVLLDLVESVIDGRPVDWDAHVTDDSSLRDRVERLRILASIAEAHRESSGDRPAPPRPDLQELSSKPAWGSLVIIERISQGKSGEVFRAYDTSLQREVALKLQLGDAGGDGAEARYVEEARRLARVRHPNVLLVHGTGRHDGRSGIWTDLVNGMNLEECLTGRGLFEPREALLIGIDLCRALAAVHATGLIHRDVKTSNVMREEGGRIVLMDFGIVADRGDNPCESVSGSPIYMAPELFQREPLSPASDLYSLGVLLFRLVTHRFPYDAADLATLVHKQKTGDRIQLLDVRPELPAPFVRVVERAIDVNPGRRFATAGSMEAALSAALETITGPGGGSLQAKGDPAAASREAANAAPEQARSGWIWKVAVGFLVTAGLLAALYRRPPATPVFTVEATLFRRTATGDERLDPGRRVQPGDRLFLEIEGSRDLNLYVLNEDEKGRAYVLFPVPGLDVKNPLPAHVRHRIPGPRDGSTQTWEVDTPGGKETLLLVASAGPLDELESEIRTFRFPERGGADVPAPEVPSRVVRTLRGIGRMSDAPPANAAGGSRLSGLIETLGTEKEEARGIWVRRIELENPDRP